MPNYGTTSITVTGPQADREALHAALAATAYNGLAFGLQKAAPDIWRADGLLRNADLAETDDALQLTVCMAYDADCLPLARSLVQRYPTLRFEAWFDCEGTWPEFTAAAHVDGVEIYHARFETAFLASLILDPATPRCCWAIAFYQRTPERDLAAATFLSSRLDPFVCKPDVVAGWRRSDDEPANPVYLMPDADEAGHLVLAINTIQGTATLLRDVNESGGYQSTEQLSFDQLRTRLPELAPEIDRLVLETASDRARHLAWQTPVPTSGFHDTEIPF